LATSWTTRLILFNEYLVNESLFIFKNANARITNKVIAGLAKVKF